MTRNLPAAATGLSHCCSCASTRQRCSASATAAGCCLAPSPALPQNRSGVPSPCSLLPSREGSSMHAHVSCLCWVLFTTSWLLEADCETLVILPNPLDSQPHPQLRHQRQPEDPPAAPAHKTLSCGRPAQQLWVLPGPRCYHCHRCRQRHGAAAGAGRPVLLALSHWVRSCARGADGMCAQLLPSCRWQRLPCSKPTGMLASNGLSCRRIQCLFKPAGVRVIHNPSVRQPMQARALPPAAAAVLAVLESTYAHARQ